MDSAKSKLPGEDGGKSPEDGQKEQKSRRLRRYLIKACTVIGLDLQIFLLMVKGALPSTIALAASQSTAWTKEYSTLSYVVCIMALLQISILPRARFLQNLAQNTCFVCLGAAFALLQFQVSVSARQSTSQSHPASGSSSQTAAEPRVPPFNGSASAVSGLGLFITIYIINVVRARYPQISLPCIVYSTFTVLASTYAPDILDMAMAKTFTKQLLVAFLTGFALSTGISLFICPKTNREYVFKETAGLLKLLGGSLVAREKYFKSLETSRSPRAGEKSSDHKDPDETSNETQESEKNDGPPRDSHAQVQSHPAATAVKDFLQRTGALYAKLNTDLDLALKEIAWGKLRPLEIKTMARHVGEIFVSVGGMHMFIGIIESTRKSYMDKTLVLENGNEKTDQEGTPKSAFGPSIQLGNDEILNKVMQGGLMHLSLVLGLAPKPKSKPADVESKGDARPIPGDPRWSSILQSRIKASRQHRKGAVAELFANGSKTTRPKCSPRELRLALYIDFITDSIAVAILHAVQWADSIAAEGSMAHSRLITPSWRNVKKLLQPWHGSEDSGSNDLASPIPGVRIGDSLRLHKIDPGHLPPATRFERWTDPIRGIPRFLASPESAIGFRTAVATMSVGILAFLPQTRTFFVDQRIQWSLVMISISMMGDAGSSVYNFVLRIGGTILAMVVSIAIWYICDQNQPAIIVLFYLCLAIGIYFLIKFPRMLRSTIISMTSLILIIGYEVQVQEVGVAKATATGQPYLPIYLLAPYRLLIVVGGLAVACFWVYFPYPVTTHEALRKDVGATLLLLANFYSSVFSCLNIRLETDGAIDNQKKGSPAHTLTKRRRKLYLRITSLFPQLRERADYTRYEPVFGGKFPRATYDELIQRMQKAFNCMAIMAHSVNVIEVGYSEQAESALHRDLRRLARDSQILCRDLTSLLCSIAASVTNSQPLPPHVQLPDLAEFRSRLDAFDYEVFSAEHIHSPGCAALAVLEVSSLTIAEEVIEIVALVRRLVGEMDFSFTVVEEPGSDEYVRLIKVTSRSEDRLPSDRLRA